MSGGVPRSSSPTRNEDGFSTGTSGMVELGVGAGGEMTVAQRMMAKMRWKEGLGETGARDYDAIDGEEQVPSITTLTKKTDRRVGVIVNAVKPPPTQVEQAGNPDQFQAWVPGPIILHQRSPASSTKSSSMHPVASLIDTKALLCSPRLKKDQISQAP
ncbi:hypothetical protein D5086_010349 [Populus alba]|uniref:Uncharacterized protein n=1 Tax=Populus alba TaxID=43335 RepID=A0ACC4C9Z0_POPAL